MNSSTNSEVTNLEILDKSALSSSRKNVTFNKDIDVRIFNKNAKNSNIVDSYVLPLAVVSGQNDANQVYGYEDDRGSLYSPNTQNYDQSYYGSFSFITIWIQVLFL